MQVGLFTFILVKWWEPVLCNSIVLGITKGHVQHQHCLESLISLRDKINEDGGVRKKIMKL
jgi:hypothetical protein